jgi:hypothetical protein
MIEAASVNEDASVKSTVKLPESVNETETETGIKTETETGIKTETETGIKTETETETETMTMTRSMTMSIIKVKPKNQNDLQHLDVHQKQPILKALTSHAPVNQAAEPVGQTLKRE